MIVGHTKFYVEHFFGVLRHYLGHRSTVLTPDEFASACDGSVDSNFKVVVLSNWMRYYKKLENYTKAFKDMRKRFLFEIRITARLYNNYKIWVYVSANRKPNGAPEPEDQFIKHPDEQIPSLDDSE